MAFGLSSGIHFCTANGQLTFLDANTGRYLALSGPGGQAFRKLMAAEPLGDADVNALMTLEASGILTSSAAADGTLAPTTAPQAQSDLSVEVPGFHPLLMTLALMAQIRMRRDVKHMTLAQVLARIAQRRNRFPRRLVPKVCIRVAAAAFNNTRMLMTTQDQCLSWSLAMLHYLMDLGIAATLILGVRRTPWSAHAWVQQGEAVLSDNLDHVTHYTPILVV